MTLVRSRSVATAAFLITVAGPLAHAAERPASFSGPYAGFDVASQNTIAGALIAGVDTLAQANRGVASLALGYRHQFAGGFVAGLEGNFGLTRGDLHHQDATNGLTIDYENSTQYALGGTLGYAFGAARETLIYAYISETKRSFDVTVRGPLGVGNQKDEQGLLRFGLGVERRTSERLSLRASVGTSRADFGDRRTNFDPKAKIDFSVGAIWQF